MAKISRQIGTTSLIVEIFILDSSSTVGAGKTGLAYNTSSLIGYYKRNTAASATAITLATCTIGTFTSGGFKEVDATHMPGLYELHIPNAALVTAADSVVVMLSGAANMVPVLLEIELTGTSNQDAVRGGMTALPNANAGASTGLPLSVDSSGRVDVLKINGTSQTARDIGASVLLSSGTGAGQVSLSSGTVTLTAGQLTIKKNAALAAFPFPMFDSAGSPRTGLTVTAEVSINGASFTTCTNAASEIGNGWYKISLAAADTNGNTLAFRFSATGAQDTDFTIVPQA